MQDECDAKINSIWRVVGEGRPDWARGRAGGEGGGAFAVRNGTIAYL